MGHFSDTVHIELRVNILMHGTKVSDKKKKSKSNFNKFQASEENSSFLF